ncbi:MAG TPA: DoxX family protein [Puia sp.]|jgi:putative oxidoreductase|nr:DoxX family protein [Puia sp.]
MKKFLSTQYSETAFNVASLVLRLTFGLLLCVNHGFEKLLHFSKLEYTFSDPFHIGHRWTLVCTIFSEVFCSLLLALGLFTRIAALILVIEFAVISFLIHKGSSLGSRELDLVYLTGFFAVLMVGPGRVSVDGMMGK